MSRQISQTPPFALDLSASGPARRTDGRIYLTDMNRNDGNGSSKGNGDDNGSSGSCSEEGKGGLDLLANISVSKELARTALVDTKATHAIARTADPTPSPSRTIPFDPELIEELFQRELAQLSMQDKLDLDEEVCGYYSRSKTSREETPDFLQHHLDRFQQELDKSSGIDKSDKRGWFLASQMQHIQQQKMRKWGSVPVPAPAPVRLSNINTSTWTSTNTTSSTSPCTTTKQSLFVFSRSYMLRFLRAEVFDVSKAALRYCKWLDLLLDYYGEVAFTRPLYLADLDKHETRLLREGSRQLLPSRDRSGRRIFCCIGDCGEDFSARVRVKVLIYLAEILSQDEATQRDGAVVLMYLSPTQRTFMKDPEYQQENARIFQGCPLRASAVHVCLLPNYDEIQERQHLQQKQQQQISNAWSFNMGGTFLDNSWTVYRILQLLLLMMFSKDTRKIVRIHIKSLTENEYCLQHEYGFPVKDIPLTSTYNVKVTDRWRSWFKLRHVIDKAHQESQLQLSQLQSPLQSQPLDVPFDCPDYKTIVFKNGGTMWDHPPNKVLRTIFCTKEEERNLASTNIQKRKIIMEIIKEVYDIDFTFCRWDTQRGWYVPFSKVLPSCCSSSTTVDDVAQQQQHDVSVDDGHHKQDTTTLIACVNSAFKDHLRRSRVRTMLLEQRKTEQDHDNIQHHQHHHQQQHQNIYDDSVHHEWGPRNSDEWRSQQPSTSMITSAFTSVPVSFLSSSISTSADDGGISYGGSRQDGCNPVLDPCQIRKRKLV